MYRRYKKKIEFFKRKLMNTILPMNNWTVLMKWDYLDWVSLILNWHVKVNPNTNCFLSLEITVVLSRVRNDSYMSLQRTKACVHAKSLQLCPTLCDPMDYSLPGSSVHGILSARKLEWGAISSFRQSPWPRDWTCISCVSCIRRLILYHWAPGKPIYILLLQNVVISRFSLWYKQ